MDTLYDVNENITAEDEDTKSEIIPEAEEENTVSDERQETEADDVDAVDYETLIASDLDALRSEFPELKGISEITELNNPLRYAALRDLGLSPAEAYMATAKRRTQDTRAHLRSAHGRNAATTMGMMSQYELATARELFPGMSDSELQRLYKKVSK
jgi:hypothetical protein